MQERYEELKSKLEIAKQAALQAGRYVRGALGRVDHFFTKTSVTDLVTEVDRQSEALIKKLLRDNFPGDRILGEEGGIEEPGTGGEEGPQPDLWIIDPLDGTTNFVQGLPFFSISIALQRGGDILLGVVYDPNREEIFYAHRNFGSWLNDKPIRVSQENTLQESLVCTGFPYNLSPEEETLINIRDVAPRVRDLRSLGSAALELAYVACGRLTGYWEWRLSPWDVAAGKLLVEEAGGCVTTCQGEPFSLSSPSILATNGRIHSELVRLLSRR